VVRAAFFLGYLQCFYKPDELPQGKPCDIRFFIEKSVDREEIYILSPAQAGSFGLIPTLYADSNELSLFEPVQARTEGSTGY
jgi:hypothetical protein